MAKNKELIERAKKLVGKEYYIEQAGWQGDHWSDEGGEFVEDGVIRFQGTPMEIKETWDEIDDDILQDCIDDVEDDNETESIEDLRPKWLGATQDMMIAVKDAVRERGDIDFPEAVEVYDSMLEYKYNVYKVAEKDGDFCLVSTDNGILWLSSLSQNFVFDVYEQVYRALTE